MGGNQPVVLSKQLTHQPSMGICCVFTVQTESRPQVPCVQRFYLESIHHPQVFGGLQDIGPQLTLSYFSPFCSSLSPVKRILKLSLRKTLSHFFRGISVLGDPLVAQLVKTLPAMQETLICFPGWEDPLGKGQATHSRIFRLPWQHRQ